MESFDKHGCNWDKDMPRNTKDLVKEITHQLLTKQKRQNLNLTLMKLHCYPDCFDKIWIFFYRILSDYPLLHSTFTYLKRGKQIEPQFR